MSRYWAVWPSVLGGGGNGLPHRQEAVRNDGAGRGVLFDSLICERWRKRDLDRWPLGCHAAKGRLAMTAWGGVVWGLGVFFVELSQVVWCSMVGDHIRIPFPVFEPVDRDPRFAWGGGRLGWAGVVEPGAGDAVVSASRRHLRENGAVVSAVSGGPALAGCGSRCCHRERRGRSAKAGCDFAEMAGSFWLAGAARVISCCWLWVPTGGNFAAAGDG